jgi:hypothetical protein
MVATPVPGDALAGFSCAPLSLKLNVCAWAIAEVRNTTLPTPNNIEKNFLMTSFPP